MRYSILLFTIYLAITSSLYAATSSEDNSCRIEDIRFQSQEEKEVIDLFLDCYYDLPISYHFDYGITEIILPNTTFDEIPAININNRFLLSLDLRKEGQKSILRILFADTDIHSVGIYDHEVKEKRIAFSISKKENTGTVLQNGQKNESPSAKESLSAPFLNKQFLEDRDTIGSIIYMLVALSIILGLIYGLLWLYNKLFLTRFNLKKGGHIIKMVSTHHIAPKQKIAILSINNIQYACGISPSSINVITRVNNGSFGDYLDATRSYSESRVDFSLLKQEYIDYQRAKEQVDQPLQKQKKSFANEFLKRVENLRPID